jgi:tetratricopeptide (TPR) repeat protein
MRTQVYRSYHSKQLSREERSGRPGPGNGLIFIAALAFMMLMSLGAMSQSNSDGLKLIEREQFKNGIEVLKAAFEEQQTAINSYRVGVGLIEAGDVAAAMAAFDKGIALDPRSALNYAGKGQLMMKEGNVQQATTLVEKALELSKSKDIAVINAVAKSWLQRPEFGAKAMSLLKKAESIEPNYESSLLLGDLFLLQGNGGAAISNYEQAATFEVRNPVPHFKIAMVYVRSTNKQSAVESLQQAVTIDPTYAPAWKEIAELHYTMKKGDEAVAAQERYLALSDNKNAGLARMGYYRFMAKDFAGAAEAFEVVWQEGLLNENGLKYFALTRNEAGDYAGAQKIFEEYFQKAKNEQVEARDYVAYAKVLLKLDQDSLAVVAFDKSLTLDDKQVSVRQLKAETLFKGKHYPQAVVAYTELIAVRTVATSQDLYSLGRAQFYTQAYQQADTTFRKLIELQPTMSVGYLWAARANSNLDPESTKGLALPFYEKVISIGQATPDKSKSELKEAYSYLGYYYILKKQAALSKLNWEKVLTIDPNDEKAKEGLKLLKGS